jgi:hypothetical protein
MSKATQKQSPKRAEKVTDGAEVKAFRTRRAAWLRVLKTFKQKAQEQGLNWQSLIADV